MPTVRYLKSILKKVQEQVKALQGGLQHINSEQTKLEKKKTQFEYMLKLRKEDAEKIILQIQKIEHLAETTLKTLS